MDETTITTLSLEQRGGFVKASAWLPDETQVFGAHAQWMLDGVALTSPPDSPGDRYYTGSVDRTEHDLCAALGSATMCTMVYVGTDAFIE